MSMESDALHAVIEGRVGDAAQLLRGGFLDSELVELHVTLARLTNLVEREIKRRDPRAPVLASADTGEINIIRGRE